jgi:hypothetical protein
MEQWPQEVTLDAKPAAQSSRPNVGFGGNSESSVSGLWPAGVVRSRRRRTARVRVRSAGRGLNRPIAGTLDDHGPQRRQWRASTIGRANVWPLNRARLAFE